MSCGCRRGTSFAQASPPDQSYERKNRRSACCLARSRGLGRRSGTRQAGLILLGREVLVAARPGFLSGGRVSETTSPLAVQTERILDARLGEPRVLRLNGAISPSASSSEWFPG